MTTLTAAAYRLLALVAQDAIATSITSDTGILNVHTCRQEPEAVGRQLVDAGYVDNSPRAAVARHRRRPRSDGRMGDRNMSAHPYPSGTRVRHGGEQYIEAYRDGTANVVRSERQGDGTYEYLVRRDKPLFEGMDLESWWASYHTHAVSN